MAGSISDFLENEILNRYVKNTTVYTPIATLYCALSTAAYSDAVVSAASMSELTVTNNYSRKPVTWGTVAAGAVANSADIVFTATGGAWATVTAMYVVDTASAGGNVLFGADLSATATLAANDSLTIASGQLTFTLT